MGNLRGVRHLIPNPMVKTKESGPKMSPTRKKENSLAQENCGGKLLPWQPRRFTCVYQLKAPPLQSAGSSGALLKCGFSGNASRYSAQQTENAEQDRRRVALSFAVLAAVQNGKPR